MTHRRHRADLDRATRLLPGLLVLALSTAGCLASGRPRRGAAPAAAAPAQGAPRERDEVRARAIADTAEAYWPYRLAELELAADSTAAAEASLEAALARDPGYEPALATLSRLWYETGRHAEAIDRLETRRRTTGLSPTLLAGLALHYQASGRPERAASVLGETPDARTRATRTAAVYVGLLGAHADSVSALAARAGRDAHASAADRNNYGVALLRSGDPTGARREFLDAIAKDPAGAPPYYNLAILEKYYAMDDSAAARWFGEYRRRSSLDPDSLAAAFRAPAPAAGRN